MKATEARKLTEQNGVSLENALESIRSHANQGIKSHLFDYVNNDVLIKLLDLGYKISKFTDNTGYEITRIEW